jgi:hypothetical protein
LSSALRRTAWPQLAIARSLHSIPIGTASAAGRLDSNGFIESAPEHRARAQAYSGKRASDKTLTFYVSLHFLVADDSTTMFFSERLSLGKFEKHVEMSREQKGRAIQGA